PLQTLTRQAAPLQRKNIMGISLEPFIQTGYRCGKTSFAHETGGQGFQNFQGLRMIVLDAFPQRLFQLRPFTSLGAQQDPLRLELVRDASSTFVGLEMLLRRFEFTQAPFNARRQEVSVGIVGPGFQAVADVSAGIDYLPFVQGSLRRAKLVIGPKVNAEPGGQARNPQDASDTHCPEAPAAPSKPGNRIEPGCAHSVLLNPSAPNLWC